MGWVTTRQYQRAFALPTVLITSVVMLTVLLSALTAASSISAGLKNQYLNQLARTASQSGMTMAKACMEGNDGAITWSSGKPLKPNTDCEGTETISCPNTATAAACYVLKSDNYRTSFKVKVLTDDDGNVTDLSAEGIIREVRKTSGEVIRESKTSLKAKLQGVKNTGSSADKSLSTTNMGTCAIADGTPYCWGYQYYGQLGTGSQTSYIQTPTAVAGAVAGKTVTKLSLSPDSSPGNGYGHGCAIADGKLYCWGYNGHYQVGNGNSTTQYSSVEIGGGLSGKTVSDVEATNMGTCAIADGSPYCWGYQNYGQLGTGSQTSYIQTPTAVAGAVAGKTVTKLSLSPDTDLGNGYGHGCAIADGKLYCWGYNAYYQVGNGNSTTQYSSVEIGGGLSGKTVTDVQATNMGTCAIADGTPYCWGYQYYGQLGTGSQTSYIQTPTAVAGAVAGKTATKLSLSPDSSPSNGYGHGCAIADGKLYCWGYNGHYQVGNGNSTTQYSSVEIGGGLSGKTVTDVDATDMGTCAVADGTPYCWGYQYYGKLGTGSQTSYIQTPTAVAGAVAGKTVTSLSIAMDTSPGNGYGHGCAIADAGLYCWGYNGHYQVGNGNNTTQYGSVGIRAGNGIPGGAPLYIAAGYKSSCAVGSDGNGYCWGRADNGYLGNGASSGNYPTPVAVSQGSIPSGVTLKDIDISMYQHTCASGSDTKLYCWGYNYYGQLGSGSNSTAYVPNNVSQNGSWNGTPTLSGVSTGYNHSCAVSSDGKAYCWGEYISGYSVAYTPLLMPQGTIPAGVTLKSISAGNYSMCALGSDGKGYCWGNNSGQLGNGSSSGQYYAPVAVSQGAVPSGVTFKSISMGSNHSCALGSDDKAYCWGQGSYGQLGNNSTGGANTPVAVSQGAIPSGVTIKSVNAGTYGTCAIGSDGKAYCWGRNASGQLGDNSTTNATTPVAVSQGAIPSGVTIKGIDQGTEHTCAIASNAKAYCWGANDSGQLGNNTTTGSTTPVEVRQAPAWGVPAVSAGSGASATGFSFY